MRIAPLLPCLLLVALALACEPKSEIPPEDSAPEGDTDTDTDTDADTDTDTDTDTDVPLVAWVVRHAEKESKGSDPGLTDEGQARAEALVEVMAEVPLVAIYATDYNRTRETCQPTATAHGLPVVDDIDPYEDLAEHIIAEHQHQQVLHCGHSWTIPAFMDSLGVPDPVTVGSNQYGDIWIVTMQGDEVISVEMGYFGE